MKLKDLLGPRFPLVGPQDLQLKSGSNGPTRCGPWEQPRPRLGEGEIFVDRIFLREGRLGHWPEVWQSLESLEHPELSEVY